MSKYSINILIFICIFLNSFSQPNYKKTADTLFNQKKFKEASDFYKLILNEKDLKEYAYTQLSECYIKLNFLDSANYYLNTALSTFPNNHKLYYLLSEYNILCQNFDYALLNINKAMSLSPDSAVYYLRKGYIYFIQDKYSNAIILFKEALNKKGKNIEEIYTNIIKTYFYLNEYDSALFYVNEALKNYNNYIFYQYKSQILFYQSKYSDAIIFINDGLDLFPNNIELIKTKVLFLNSLNQYNEIVNLINSELAYKDEDLMYYLIISNYYLNQLDLVKNYLNEAKKIFPNNEQFYWIDGYISFKNQDYYNAYINFLAANTQNPNKVDYYIYLCTCKNILNSDTSLFDNQVKFKNYNFSKSTKSIKKDKLYIEKIKKKFENDPTNLGIEEYYILYLSNTFDKNFNGYLKFNKELSDAYDKENYKYCIELCKLFIDQNPYYPYTYLIIANSYFFLKNYERSIYYLTIYYGFLNAILATGNGNSEDNPYIVAYFNDELLILKSIGASPAGQNFKKIKKSYFDIIYYYTNDNKKNNIYFYINLFYK